MLSSDEREAKIIAQAEKRALAGEDHFPARSMLNALAIAFMDEPERSEFLVRSNENIIRMLGEHGMRGVVYTIREDYSSGFEDQPDYVLVHERDGKRTGATGRFGTMLIREPRISSDT